jgi:exodeoxyribonuclease VII small subunit
MGASEENKMSFEESISRLEKIVAQLQTGELPLDQALQLFEEGVGLSRQCQTQLEAVERRVEILVKEKGGLELTPFGATGSRPQLLPDDEEDDEDDDDDDDDDF